MRGHVRKHGRGWAVIVGLGEHPGRVCTNPNRRSRHTTWTTTPEPANCSRCGADLGPVKTRRRQQWYSGFSTKKAATDKLTAVLASLQGGEFVEPTKSTVESYARTVWFPYLEDRVAAGKLRRSTVAWYRNILEGHILPRIGAVRLQTLTAVQLDALYAELRRSGRRVGTKKLPAGLSEASIRAVHITIGKLLTHAVQKQVLARNVAKDAEAPVAVSAEQVIWTPEQAAAFIEATKGTREHAAWLLALLCGLRRGEIAGLSWSNVDLDGRKVTVASTRVSVGYEVVESTPKTEKGKRTIAVAPAVASALREQLVRQKTERLAWGSSWVDTGLVLTKEDGTGYHPQHLTRLFQGAAKRAGVPVLPLHACRHFHATNGLREGIDITVMSKRLGHSSVSITADVYSHEVEELDEDAATRTALGMTAG